MQASADLHSRKLWSSTASTTSRPSSPRPRDRFVGCVCVCVPRAVHTHDSLRILEASSCGHMFNMSSSQVTNGNGAMPAFGEKLGPDDIEAGMQVQRRRYGLLAYRHANARSVRLAKVVYNAV